MKNKLIQYIDLKEEINDLEKRIDKIERQNVVVSDKVKGSYKEFPYTEHNIKIMGIENEKQDLINKYKLILKENYNKLLEKQIEIEEYIEEIAESRIRRILRSRYIDGLNWTQLAHKLHTTPDSIRMEHNRFLNKKI